MGNVNMAIIAGRLSRDPEARSTQGGKKIVTLNIPTEDSYVKNGERVKETTWHKVVVFNDHTAAFCEQYLFKGSWVHVQGQIVHGSFTNNAGVEVKTSEIHVKAFGGSVTSIGDAPKEPQERTAEPERARAPARSSKPPREAAPPPQDDLDDEIPF